MTSEDYATMPVPSDPQLSPDGRRVAFVLTGADMERSMYDPDVWLVGADGSNPISLAHSSRRDAMPRWAPDGRRIAFLSNRGESAQIWLIDPDGGEASQLTRHPTPIDWFAWSPEGERIAFLARDPEPAAEAAAREARDDARVVGQAERHQHLWTIAPGSGSSSRITSGDFSVIGFDWSPDGKRFALVTAPGTGLADRFGADLHLVSSTGGPTEPLLVRAGPDFAPRFSPDGRWIAFSSGEGAIDWAADQHLAVLPVGGGEPRVVSAAYDRHLEQFTWASDSRALYFDGQWNMRHQLWRIGLDGRLADLSGLPGVSSQAHFVPAADRVAFIHQNLTTPPEVWISPIGTFRPKRLTDVNARHRDLQLAPTRVVRWKNPNDGLEIEGLLTLPLFYRSGTRVPLLLFVHGGPSSSFNEEFLGYLHHVYPVHVFAARGYAVLRPNVRGSGGYGSAFRQLNRADWGGGDFDDAMAGVDHLVAEGIADPSRLGIMGWSYGGFLSAWAITQTDRFRAASIGAPVIDLLSMEGTSDIPGFIGSFFAVVPWREQELLRERSPLTHLAKAKTPALIQHGEEDRRVPLSQGRILYRALRDLGVPVTMVIYPRTPHVAREPRLRIDVMNRNLSWFDRFLSDDR